MFEKAQEGKNLVITTSTASGKTLSFLLPVLQEILKDPLARAIFIYPTKALAADQYRAIQPVIDYFGETGFRQEFMTGIRRQVRGAGSVKCEPDTYQSGNA